MKFKSIITVFYLFYIGVLAAQNNSHHYCSQNKIKAFQQAKLSNNKSLNGQEKYDLNYVKLDLSLDNLSTNIDAGQATLKGKVTALTLDILILELHEDLIVDSAKINGNIIAVNRINDELQLFPTNNLAQNTEFIAEIFYHGAPPNNGSFFGGIFNDASPRWGANVTWTLSQPFNAYTWWPCKQDLVDKIDSSEVWLTVPNNLKAGSNGLLQNEITLPNNKTRFEWKHNHPIDYYLISLAVGPYIEYSFNAALPGTNDSVLVQNYIYDNPNTLIEFKDDIDQTADMMYVFSELFGMYPFVNEKYGHCMAPLSGGMEHQTMTTQGFFEQGLTAHELGHQWFGDYVTCQNWGHIWVNEGFASYSEYLFQETVNYNNAQQDMLGVHNNIMNEPGGSVYVVNQTDENEIFDARLTYDKGGAIIHTIRHWVNNDAVFFTALKNYQQTFANGTAVAEDLINIVENESQVDFSNFLAHWFYGEGYPIYSGFFNDYEGQVLVQLDQSTSKPNVTPFFESFIEIKIDFIDNSDTTIRVRNTYNNQHYLFDIDKEVYAINIDPNNWIINRENNFVKDVNFITINTGIRNQDLITNLSIYPNPSKSEFVLNNNNNENGVLVVLNNLGQKVYSKNIIGGSNTIKHQLIPGVYFVNVEFENGVYKDKLVVE